MSVLCRQPKTQVLVNLNSIVQQNNTSIMNRLSSVPATGEARTYCRFVVYPQKLQAPEHSLLQQCMNYILHYTYRQNICLAHMASPKQENLKALRN